MAIRASAAKQLRVSGSERLGAFVLVIAIACVPVLGTVLAIVSTTEPDLSELTPIWHPPGQNVLLNWFALRQGRFSAGAPVQALGYVVETTGRSTQVIQSGILFCFLNPEIYCTRHTGFPIR
jgi:hypothetical protein